MRSFFLIITLVAFVVVACNKDKFLTKPSISIKSMSDDFIPLNGKLVLVLDCTDKEGDVQDSVIVIKRRLNKRVTMTVRDTLRFKFPAFPKTPRTQIQATFNYLDLQSAITPPFIPNSNPAKREDDTLRLRFAVKDNAGNTSDTIETPLIYVHRQ